MESASTLGENDYSTIEPYDESSTIFTKVISEIAISENHLKANNVLQLSNLKFSTFDYTIFGIMLALSGKCHHNCENSTNYNIPFSFDWCLFWFHFEEKAK